MDLFVSPRDEIWFLCVCHHISNAVYSSVCTICNMFVNQLVDCLYLMFLKVWFFCTARDVLQLHVGYHIYQVLFSMSRLMELAPHAYGISFHFFLVRYRGMSDVIDDQYHHHHWLDSPWWTLAFLRNFAHSSLSRAAFFQLLTPNTRVSWTTPSSHHNFGLPTLLVPSGLVLNIFLRVLSLLIRIRCPAHASLLVLI